MNSREDFIHGLVEMDMKTFPLLLLGLGALGSCTMGPPRMVERAAEQRSLAVIALQYASAVEVANALNKLKPNTRLVADQRTNSVIVSYAGEADLKDLTDCIARLDIEVHGAK